MDFLQIQSKTLVLKKIYHLLIRILGGVLILSLLFTGSHARVEYPGKPGAYLRMGIGSRPMGLGGAYTGVSDDIYAAHYNPGGLSQLDHKELVLSRKLLSMDRRHSFVGWASSLGPGVTYALYWVNAGTSDVPEIDLSGVFRGSLRDNKNAFGISFSRELPAGLSLGFGFRNLLHNLAGEEGKGYGVDAAVMFKPFESFRLGIMARDISSRLTWRAKRWDEVIDKRETFPTIYLVGASWEIIKKEFLVSIQGDIWSEAETIFNIGAEYTYNTTLTIRGGLHSYNSGDKFEAVSWVMGLTINSFPFSKSFRTEFTYATDPLGIRNESVVSIVYRR